MKLPKSTDAPATAFAKPKSSSLIARVILMRQKRNRDHCRKNLGGAGYVQHIQRNGKTHNRTANHADSLAYDKQDELLVSNHYDSRPLKSSYPNRRKICVSPVARRIAIAGRFMPLKVVFFTIE